MSWQDALILEENEEIIQSWNGNQEIEERVVERRSYGRKRIAKAKQRVNGFLVMTNQKLVFLEEHGVFGKSYHQTLTIPLENVQGISQGGAVYKFISITDDQGRYLFHLRAQFDAFRNVVMEAIKQRKQELEKARRKERVHILLDFSSLRDYMNKGGLALRSVRCPECNAPVELPDSGNQIKCEHCGNLIYAQDIFEKIKALIG
jgi:NADH pyrophosphatase NudC (nudix superfamily)